MTPSPPHTILILPIPLTLTLTYTGFDPQWVSETIEPVLKDLRRMLLITKPADHYDFIAGYCYREALGQPHPADIARLNRKPKEKKGGNRRGSMIAVRKSVSVSISVSISVSVSICQ
jgi:hypothetical protein